MGHKHSKPQVREVLGEAYKSQAQTYQAKTYKDQVVDQTEEGSYESSKTAAYRWPTVVLTQLDLVKFKVECSKNFFTWIQGQIFNSIEFQWQAQGDGYLLDNVWKSTKDGKFWCPSSRFGQFSKAFLMAAAEFAELDLSEATESSTDDSQVTGYYMYDDGAFRASIEKIHGGGTVFVDSNARLIRPKKLGKGIHDLLVPE